MNNKPLRILTIIISILLIGSFALLYDSLEKIKLQDTLINNLTTLSESQKGTISQLEISIADLRKNLSAEEELLKNENQTIQRLQKEIINLTTVAKSDYGVLAVDESDNGHLIPLEVILKSGNGNLFLNVANVVYDETLQSSAQTAVHVARDITGTSLVDKDVLINIESQPTGQTLILSGGSGGAAMTLAVIAAMQGKKLRNDVYITGTIGEDHSIGKIGAARAKGLAAKENGAVLFLVPPGQKSDVGDIGIEVREVATVEDAAEYAILP